jgi:transposase
VYIRSRRERQELEQLYRDTKNADVRARCEMILLSNEGLSPPKIAHRVRFSRYTVARSIQRYKQEGIAGLDVSTEEGVQTYYARNLQEET